MVVGARAFRMKQKSFFERFSRFFSIYFPLFSSLRFPYVRLTDYAQTPSSYRSQTGQHSQVTNENRQLSLSLHNFFLSRRRVSGAVLIKPAVIAI